MKKSILIYGVLLAIIIPLLKIMEYKYIIRDLVLESYIGLIALIFTSLGIWVGFKIINREQNISVHQTDLIPNKKSIQYFGISDREFEVLTLMEKGMSNQEIANKLFLSLHTIKTHTSNLFSKLNVKRRTQAIQKARSLKILI